MRIITVGKKTYRKFVDKEMERYFEDFCGKRIGRDYKRIYLFKEKILRFAAMDGKKVVGAVSLMIGPGIARIGAFAVAKGKRNAGIGSQLLEKCDGTARKMGCRKIWLFACKEMGAYKFYRERGFCEEALLKKQWGGMADLVVMSKFL